MWRRLGVSNPDFIGIVMLHETFNIDLKSEAIKLKVYKQSQSLQIDRFNIRNNQVRTIMRSRALVEILEILGADSRLFLSESLTNGEDHNANYRGQRLRALRGATCATFRPIVFYY